MAYDCAGALQVCRARFARLDEGGAPLAGDGNLLVSDALILLRAEPVTEEGTVIRVPNGCGDFCINFRDDPRLVGFNVTIEICTPHPEAQALLAGGEVLMDGPDVVGYVPPPVGQAPNPNGVSVEAWSKAVIGDHQVDDRPWWRVVYTRLKLVPAGKNQENAAMQTIFSGITQENPAWGDGPANDVPYLTDRSYAMFRDDDDAVPEAECESQTLVAS